MTSTTSIPTGENKTLAYVANKDFVKQIYERANEYRLFQFGVNAATTVAPFVAPVLTKLQSTQSVQAVDEWTAWGLETAEKRSVETWQTVNEKVYAPIDRVLTIGEELADKVLDDADEYIHLDVDVSDDENNEEGATALASTTTAGKTLGELTDFASKDGKRFKPAGPNQKPAKERIYALGSRITKKVVVTGEEQFGWIRETTLGRPVVDASVAFYEYLAALIYSTSEAWNAGLKKTREAVKEKSEQITDLKDRSTETLAELKTKGTETVSKGAEIALQLTKDALADVGEKGLYASGTDAVGSLQEKSKELLGKGLEKGLEKGQEYLEKGLEKGQEYFPDGKERVDDLIEKASTLWNGETEEADVEDLAAVVEKEVLKSEEEEEEEEDEEKI